MLWTKCQSESVDLRSASGPLMYHILLWTKCQSKSVDLRSASGPLNYIIGSLKSVDLKSASGPLTYSNSHVFPQPDVFKLCFPVIVNVYW